MLKTELEQAKDLLNHISQDNTLTYSEVFLVAKYYKFTGLDVSANVESYIRARAFQYNEVVYERWIDMVSEGTQKYKLRTLDSIPVTQKEIATFKGLNDCGEYKAMKLLFAMWVYCKYEIITSSAYLENKTERIKNIYIRHGKTQLCEAAGLRNVSKSEYDDLWVTLYNKDLLALFSGNREALINTVDLYGQVVDHIRIDEDMHFWLDNLIGRKNIFQCQRCGKWKKSSSTRVTNQKYCHDCRVEIDREKDLEKKRKKRKK